MEKFESDIINSINVLQQGGTFYTLQTPFGELVATLQMHTPYKKFISLKKEKKKNR